MQTKIDIPGDTIPEAAKRAVALGRIPTARVAARRANTVLDTPNAEDAHALLRLLAADSPWGGEQRARHAAAPNQRLAVQ